MAGHAKDTLRGAGIAQVLDLALAVAAAEAIGAEGLVARQDGQVFDLVAAVVAAVGAVVAYQGAVAEQQEVRVRVEQGAAGVAAEAVDVPSVASCCALVCHPTRAVGRAGARDGVSARNAYRARMPFLPQESGLQSATARLPQTGWSTSPHPLHGYTTSSWSSGDSGYAPGDSMLDESSVRVCRRGVHSNRSAVTVSSWRADCSAPKCRYEGNAERWVWMSAVGPKRGDKSRLHRVELRDLDPISRSKSAISSSSSSSPTTR